ncbi:MAG: helix-turn-helix domain-containing protein [Terracidiphilus sp.]
MKVRKHLTQRVLAEKLDVNRKTISRWENRQIPLPLYVEPALRDILRGICEKQYHEACFTFIDLFAGIGGIRKVMRPESCTPTPSKIYADLGVRR